MTRITRGFHGRRRPDVDPARVPPGQYVTQDFPVLSAGPTPHGSLDSWSFTIRGQVDQPHTWTWDEFQALSRETVTRDIHCVTKWSKLDTVWDGVSVDTLLAEAAKRGVQPGPFVMAVSDGGYTTNLLLADVTGGKAWIVMNYSGEPLPSEHGGPARLLVPHLYFWKSAKWLKGLRFTPRNEAGFGELRGYHLYGDPWREQRYTNDP